MRSIWRGNGCKVVVACALVSIAGCVIVDALYRAANDDGICASWFIIGGIICMWLALPLVWGWRLGGRSAERERQFFRNHPLSPWEANQYRMFGGWVCADCGRLNPNQNVTCYRCGTRK